jgi:Xaa-Pro aminopeptidase
MEERGIDLLLAYSDDRATYGQQFTRYLYDYQPHFEPALIVMHVAEQDFIATGPESIGFVEANSDCSNVVVVDAFAHPDEEYPFSKVTPLSALLQDLIGHTRSACIGLAGRDAVPADLYGTIASVAPRELVDATSLFTRLRARKSDAEIEVIRYAYKIAQEGMRAALAALRPGVSERDLAAEAEYVMRRMGSEGMGIDTIVGSGRDNTRTILTRTTRRKIEYGDHVLLTIAPRYEGYHGAIGRVAALGQIDPDISRAYAVAKNAQDAARAQLRPGALGKDLDAAARRVVEDAGLGRHFAYSGIHSVGVTEFEPPILTSWHDEPLEESMVFSIDIPIFFATWGGLRLEDGFVITSSGAEALQELPWGMTCAA